MDHRDITPEDPAKLTGPEVGALCHYTSSYERFNNLVVRVLRRSYVWAPNERYGSFYGYRHYDWTVIEFGPGRTMVVDDVDLRVIEPGDRFVRDISVTD